MTDLWWCETCNQLYPGEMQDQAVTVECRMVRLTAHHQDGRLIGLLAWDRCDDGWVPRANVRTEHADPFFSETYDYDYAAIPLEDADD